MPWIDIAVIVILIISALIGVSKGFLKSLIGLFGTVVTLALAIWLAKPAADLINGWWGLDATFGGLVNGPVSEAFAETIPNAFGMLLSAIFGVPPSPVTPAYIDGICAQLGSIMSTVVVAVGLFIVIKIIVWLLSKLFDAITKNRAISGLDRILGFVFGIVKGAVFVVVVLGLLFLLGTYVPAISGWFNPLLADSPITNWAYGFIADFVEYTLIPYFTG